MNRAHASVQYATEVGRGGVSSPDPLGCHFSRTVPKLSFRRGGGGGGGGGDVEPLPQRPLSQARPAERLRFTE